MFDIAAFRRALPAFADSTFYSDAAITAAAGMADCYISTSSRWYRCEQCAGLMQMLITAHLLQLNGTEFVPGAAATGVMTSASIDGVSVGFAVNTANKGSFMSWLDKTPYGEQLSGLLSRFSRSIGYIGGSPERRGFRKIGGGF